MRNLAHLTEHGVGHVPTVDIDDEEDARQPQADPQRCLVTTLIGMHRDGKRGPMAEAGRLLAEHGRAARMMLLGGVAQVDADWRRVDALLERCGLMEIDGGEL